MFRANAALKASALTTALLLSATTAAAQTAKSCTLATVRTFDRTDQVCTCSGISRQAREFLRRADNFGSIIGSAAARCPSHVAFLIRPDDADFRANKWIAGDPRTVSTSVAPTTPSQAPSAAPDPTPSLQPGKSGKPKDDNGHGNDDGNYDSSNPGGKG